MSSTDISYYAILRDSLLAVKSNSRRTVSSDGVECIRARLASESYEDQSG
jgi:hypothetical protein